MKWYRYAFIDGNGNYITVDNAGAVTFSTTPVYTHHSPFDWKDMEVKVQRDLDTFGLSRTFTLPMNFVKDGAKVVRYMLYTYGYNAYTRLVIQKREHTTLEFKDYVACEVDYTKFYDDKSAFTTRINLMDNALADMLKSVGSVDVEIQLDNDPDTLTIDMDGIELQNKAVWTVTDGSDPSNNPAGAHIWHTSLIVADTMGGMDVRDVSWKKWTNSSDFINDSWFYTASTGRAFTISWDFKIDFNSIPFASYSVNQPVIQILKAAGGSSSTTEVHRILDLTGVAPVTFLNSTYHQAGSVTITPVAGDRFYFTTRLFPAPASANFINFNYQSGSKIEMSFFSRTPATSTKGMRFKDVWNKLLKKQSDNKYSLKSNYLSANQFGPSGDFESIAPNCVLTSGDAVRGLQGATIKISHNKLMEFARNCWALGASVEGDQLRVEPLKVLMDRTNTLFSIGEVNKLKCYTADDLLAASVTIGYDDKQYDLLNGKDEFNSKHQYTLPVGTRPKRNLDMISSIRPDMYGIEYVRIRSYQKETTDTNSDDSVFIVQVENAPTVGKYKLQRRLSPPITGGSVQGLISPDTAYNFGFSPKRCLIRNLPWLYSLLPEGKGAIKYQTSTKNNALRTMFGIVIDEDGDIDVANFFPWQHEHRLFAPYYLEFDVVSPDNLLELLGTTPYGLVAFNYKGLTYKGFVVEVGLKLGVRDT